MSDPVADMIIRIKNALLARREVTVVPFSRLKENVAVILKKEGYINDYSVTKDGLFDVIKVDLKYINRIPAISDVKKISKPGRRIYADAKNIPQALGGYGITIVSTNKGVITGKEARQLGVGGEVLCQIW